MANIIINNYCNLRCKYCFATEITKETSQNITIEQLNQITDFLLHSNAQVIGIIGGEPLLHPQFDKLMSVLIDKIVNLRTKAVVYTNGICIDKHLAVLSHPKIAMLINTNSENDIDNLNFSRLTNNLDNVFLKYKMAYKTTLGLNLYSPNQEIDWFFELLLKYSIKNIRISVVVPENCDVGSKQYFQPFFPLLVKLFTFCNKYEIAANFDCNLVPICLVSKELLELFKVNEKLYGRKVYLSTKKTACEPVIDIAPDGTTSRCFAFAGHAPLNIYDFDNLDQITNAYKFVIDYKYTTNNCLSECEECKYGVSHFCYGGCLKFRI